MDIKIALAGNPNCGKTTIFNALTGSNQFVGNWPGVTVEKKEGKLKGHDGITVTDLPGIYSLSPYTPEEIVARKYLVDERPDAILDIIDGTNLERNLYLTTQLVEIGIPVVMAINMMDVVEKNGDKIDTAALSKAFGCRVITVSAIKEQNLVDAVLLAAEAAKEKAPVPVHRFSGVVEHALAHIEEATVHGLPLEKQRWYSVKLFERDQKVIEDLKISKEQLSHIEDDIAAAEKELGDDSESIIINERYNYIESVIKDCYTRKNNGLTTSDKIDKIVTNRWLALPIFAVIMFLVYFISVSTVGSWATDWANDGLFGEGWHLFGIGSAEYNEEITEYAKENIWTDELDTVLGAASASSQAGADDMIAAIEEGDYGAFEDAYNSYGEALTKNGFDVSSIVEPALEGAPDSSDYGIWVPGVPVLLTNLLEKNQLCGLDNKPCRRWNCRRRGRCFGICAADVCSVLVPCVFGGMRIHVENSVFDGQVLPQVRIVRKVVHTHTHRHRLRRSGNNGVENDRKRKRQKNDHNHDHLYPLRSKAAGNSAHRFDDVRRRVVGCAERVLCRNRGYYNLGNNAQKDKAVRGKALSVCNGASRISHADL